MLAKISRIFYGWRMIAVGSALRILGGGLYYYGFSVFFLPLSHDLGLSRAATSLVFSLARAQGAFEGPVAGYIMDRFGPRPLILTAIMMNGVGHMLLSNVHSYFALVLIYMGVVSLSFQAGFMDAPMVIANTWFIRMRTLAMSLISASVNVGGFLLTPLLASAVYYWGWRRAAFGNGIAFLLLGLPTTLLFGWLADRVNKPKLMAVCMLFAMLALLILIFSEKEWQIWCFLPLFSLVESTFPVNWSTVGEFFGRPHFAKIRGSMVFVQAWGAVLGPVAAGAIYDRTQSYSYLLWDLVGVLFIVGCLYAMVVRPSKTLSSEFPAPV